MMMKLTTINVIAKYLRNCTGGLTVRCLSNSSLNKERMTTSGKFVPVYKFPYIRPLSIINRIKFYQTILTVTSIPITAIMVHMNYVDEEALRVTSALGAYGCITLYSLGLLTSKFIGFIYYNEETDMAKVAYVDFWGNRKDLEIPANDIIPIQELPRTYWDGLFYTFRRYSTKKTLRLNMQFGVILDKEKISKIL